MDDGNMPAEFVRENQVSYATFRIKKHHTNLNYALKMPSVTAINENSKHLVAIFEDCI